MGVMNLSRLCDEVKDKTLKEKLCSEFQVNKEVSLMNFSV